MARKTPQVPTVLTHAVSGIVLGSTFRRSLGAGRVWFAGALCAALPDVDVIGFRSGIQYGDLLGHRGLTHSPTFAAVLAALVVAVAFPHGALGSSRRALWLYLFVATASHGCLDALTDGGLGVAFFSPFSNARYYFPVRPIRVSPIGLRAFVSEDGLAVLASEIRWVWVPSAVVMAITFASHRRPTLRRPPRPRRSSGRSIPP